MLRHRRKPGTLAHDDQQKTAEQLLLHHQADLGCRLEKPLQNNSGRPVLHMPQVPGLELQLWAEGLNRFPELRVNVTAKYALRCTDAEYSCG